MRRWSRLYSHVLIEYEWSSSMKIGLYKKQTRTSCIKYRVSFDYKILNFCVFCFYFRRGNNIVSVKWNCIWNTSGWRRCWNIRLVNTRKCAPERKPLFLVWRNNPIFLMHGNSLQLEPYRMHTVQPGCSASYSNMNCILQVWIRIEGRDRTTRCSIPRK